MRYVVQDPVKQAYSRLLRVPLVPSSHSARVSINQHLLLLLNKLRTPCGAKLPDRLPVMQSLGDGCVEESCDGFGLVYDDYDYKEKVARILGTPLWPKKVGEPSVSIANSKT